MPTHRQQVFSGQRHLATHDEFMGSLIVRYGDCTITPHDNYYGELIDSIVSQQLSVKAARTIHGRVLAIYNQNPSPQELLDTPDETLRSAGCSYAKVRYLKDLASHVADGRLDLLSLPNLSNEAVIAQLTAVKGIGEWSAHMFMIFSLGRLDILPTGDLGVRKAAMLAYGLPELPTPSTLTALALQHQWQPYASIASWYLWKSLDNT